MTSEDEFQARLDECPDDHVCRLVLADWLEERGDPRAEGYRALGRNLVCPAPSSRSGLWVWWNYSAYHVDPFPNGYAHYLPADWFSMVSKSPNGGVHYARWNCRRRADDAAALAFAKLPAARRAELLSGKGVACG